MLGHRKTSVLQQKFSDLALGWPYEEHSQEAIDNLKKLLKKRRLFNEDKDLEIEFPHGGIMGFVDSVNQIDRVVKISGWAIDYLGLPLDEFKLAFSGTDSLAPVSVMRVNRPDVVKKFPLAQINSGFDIEFVLPNDFPIELNLDKLELWALKATSASIGLLNHPKIKPVQ